MSTNTWKHNVCGFKPAVSRKLGTVANVIAVSLPLTASRGRSGWASWVGRTVPFLTFGEISVSFTVLYQKSDYPTQLILPLETSTWPNPQPSSPWCHSVRPLHAVLPSTPSYPFCFPSFLPLAAISPPRMPGTWPHTTLKSSPCFAAPPLHFGLSEGWHRWNAMAVQFQFPEQKAGNKVACLYPVTLGAVSCCWQEQAGVWTQLLVLKDHKRNTLHHTTGHCLLPCLLQWSPLNENRNRNTLSNTASAFSLLVSSNL